MTDNGTDALEQALALHTTPAKVPLVRERQLPGAVLQLIRIAAGDREALASAAGRTAESPQRVADAALFYIQQVLFHEDADCYRTLGVRPDASDDTIKEHYRWLARWLHPDRHPERWEVVYSGRVNKAWNSLNSAQRRGDYDARMGPRVELERGGLATSRHDARLRPTGMVLAHSTPSHHPISKLKRLILRGLAASGFAVLVILYWTQRDQQEDADAAVDRAGAAEVDDASSAQEAAIRRRIAFAEHVIELSRPVEPAQTPPVSPPTPEQSTAIVSTAVEGKTADSDVETGTAPTTQSAAAIQRVASLPTPNSQATHVTESAAPQLDQSSIKQIDQAIPVANAVDSSFPRRRQSISNDRLVPRLRGDDSKGVLQTLPGMKLLQVDPSVAAPSTSATTSRQPPTPSPSAPRPVATSPSSYQVATQTPSMIPMILPVARHRLPKPNPIPVQVAVSAPPDITISAPTVESATYAGGVTAQLATTTLPRDFAAAYASGDLMQMMGLFAPDAVDNRGGIKAIAEDYQHLFQDTSSRELSLEGMTWTVRADRITGSGPFQARNRKHDEASVNRVRGWIQIEAIPIDGRWKIQRIVHRNAE